MASVAASKPVSRKPKQGQKDLLSANPRVLEGLAVLLFGLSVFLVVAFFTYDPRDPSLNRVTPNTWQVRNSAGVAGAYVADAAGQLLGAAALVLPLAGLLIGFRWIRGRRVEGKWLLAGGLLAGTAVAAVTLHDWAGHADPLFGTRIHAGGLLGGFLRPLLFRFLGGVGAYLILAAAGVFACLQVAALGLSDLLKGLSKASTLFAGGIRFSAVSLFNGSSWLVRRVWRGAVASAKFLKRLSIGFGRFAVRSAAWVNPMRIPWAETYRRFRPRRAEKPRTVPGSVPSSVAGDQPSPVPGDQEVPLQLDPIPVGGPIPLRDIVKNRPWVVEGSSESMDADEAGFEAKSEKDIVSPASSAPPAPAIEIASPIERVRRARRRAHALPPLTLLDAPPPLVAPAGREVLTERSARLEEKLRDFGVEGRVVQVLHGPVVTMFEYAPASGVKVSKIANLSDDLALGMEALSVRIVAPLPGKGAVGIEIPNEVRMPVNLKEILTSRDFQDHDGRLSIALGKDILGRPAITDLAKIPHLLIAGATGSGKSVGLNAMICSLLLRRTPGELRFVMIDPKMLELSVYDGIPHLLTPVVTDPKRASVVLKGLVAEMESRYHLLSEAGVRNIQGYNEKVTAPEGRANGRDKVPPEDAEAPPPSPPEPLPSIVVVIDELADLMMVTSKDVENSIVRLAQMARAAGIHLMVATQRPSVDVLTGLIKANFPARLSFQVSSRTDSRTILDANGAERLLGQGDMLFLPPGTSNLVRIHGAYVSEREIERVVESWKSQGDPEYDHALIVSEGDGSGGDDQEEAEYDEKYDEAVEFVARTGQASISKVQRRLRVGYNRAARMIEMMERDGVVGPADGVKPREVFAREIPADD